MSPIVANTLRLLMSNISSVAAEVCRARHQYHVRPCPSCQDEFEETFNWMMGQLKIDQHRRGRKKV